MGSFSNVEKWAFTRQVDEEYGEWHQDITHEGEHRGETGSLWKIPYHTARACIELVRRLNGLGRQVVGETSHVWIDCPEPE